MAGRKSKKTATRQKTTTNTAESLKGQTKVNLPKPPSKVTKLGRPPSTAAITITVPEHSEDLYAAVMSAAKKKINLSECGIQTVRTRRAITGALKLEVIGPDSSSKADILASKMREELADMKVHIARPTKMGELRVLDLDESVDPAEVAAAVVEAGGCSLEDVKVGKIRRQPLRLGSIWVRCPLGVARKLVAAKTVRVGWTAARVQVLAQRPLQCYRCLEMGHVRSRCPNEQDRSTRCYACSESGHRASHCAAAILKCPLCTDLGRPAEHRLGTKGCVPQEKAKEGRSKQASSSKAICVPEAMETSHSTES